jgi:hypothetical protein
MPASAVRKSRFSIFIEFGLRYGDSTFRFSFWQIFPAFVKKIGAANFGEVHALKLKATGTAG